MKLNAIQRKKFRVTNKVKNVSSPDRFRLSISRSILSDFLPNGPSMLRTLPESTALTFSGIEILILPILDIKIPYRLFHHQLFVF